MSSHRFFILNSTIVNEGRSFVGDVLVEDGMISYVSSDGSGGLSCMMQNNDRYIDAGGKYLIPGIIDTHVHFREPGFPDKADIYSESKAAVAGGVTSFMDMPNTEPKALDHKILEDKFEIASKRSLANFSFYIGLSNDNLDEVLKTDPHKVCGVKLFLGASTGNMLVDDASTLESLFAKSPMIIAVHSEDEGIISNNIRKFKEKYGNDIPVELHPLIRNEEACYRSSSLAVELARKHNSRLHLLHLSTAKELQLLDNAVSPKDKRITSEVCVHHLIFNNSDYEELGALIKVNPAIKTLSDQKTLFNALLDNKIDTIATDHAPHTPEEKRKNYINSPSGIPMIQHSLVVMLEFLHQGKISIEKIVEKMCHAPAICFNIEKRGFIREGYRADLVIIDNDAPWKVSKNNILYKCRWSPLEGRTFKSKITHTFVNGNLVYENGKFNEKIKGQRLSFSVND